MGPDSFIHEDCKSEKGTPVVEKRDVDRADMAAAEQSPGLPGRQSPGRLAVPRRSVIQGAALAGVGLALAGCGKDGDTSPTADAGNTGSNPPTESPSPSESDSVALAATADIPVHGGIIVDDKVVVTQPEQGTFKAFSAICTHQGCVVSGVADGVISCPCHGSTYSAEDGSVLGGPAPSPLPEVPVEVKQGEVVRA
ncbi:MAG: Rieske (2Fe-2S) protein [Candidatus Nanopelagicales bacterium]